MAGQYIKVNLACFVMIAMIGLGNSACASGIDGCADCRDSKCARCQEGFVIAASGCQKCPDNCFDCTENKYCKVCQPLYYSYAGSCRTKPSLKSGAGVTIIVILLLLIIAGAGAYGYKKVWRDYEENNFKDFRGQQLPYINNQKSTVTHNSNSPIQPSQYSENTPRNHETEHQLSERLPLYPNKHSN